MARKAAKKSPRKASKKTVKKKAAKRKPAKKTARRAVTKTVRKATRKPARKAVKKAAKRARRPSGSRTGPIAALVRSLDIRPNEELAFELDKYDGRDDHSDPAIVETAAVVRAAAAIAQWRVAKSLLKLRALVDIMAPNRSKASDGTIGDTRHCGRPSSTSDHCPRIRDAGVGVVAAMDITHDPAGGCDAGALAQAIRASRDSRVKYIIWNRRIANSAPMGGSPAWAWRPYNGANPHDHHVHISVKPSKPQYDSESGWTLTGG